MFEEKIFPDTKHSQHNKFDSGFRSTFYAFGITKANIFLVPLLCTIFSTSLHERCSINLINFAFRLEIEMKNSIKQIDGRNVANKWNWINHSLKKNLGLWGSVRKLRTSNLLLKFHINKTKFFFLLLNFLP